MIINDTMFIVRQQAARFRADSRVSTWVMGIASRHGLRSLHDTTRAEAHAVSPEFAGEPVESRDAEYREWLGKALAELSSDHRIALEFTYYGGYSCEEVAAIMGCPVNTVKTRMFYARDRLRSILAALATPVGGDS